MVFVIFLVGDVPILFAQVEGRHWSLVEINVVDPVRFVVVQRHHDLAY
jgi:hypothetical protein